MSVSRWLDQSHLNPSRTFDAVIVGGGIAGLSTAYWLQKYHPDWKVALIERRSLGFGASGRNAGFVTCGSLEHFINLEKNFGAPKALEIWKYSEENHRLLLEHFIKDNEDQVDYQKTGSCTVAPDESRFKTYEGVAERMMRHGINVHPVGPAELEKNYGIKGFSGGIQYDEDGVIHPIKLLKKIRSKLKADIFEHTEVFGLSRDGEKQTVHADLGNFTATKIFLTLNAYLPLVLKNFEKLIAPARGQILMTEPLPAFAKGPCYLTKHLCYFRQLPTGHLLVGGFRNLAVAEEASYADQTTTLIQDALWKFIQDHFPAASKAGIAYQWSGIMGFTPDGQMLVGAPSDNPHIHIMAGCSGHGMGLSFHTAKILVQSLQKKTIPSHLEIGRFF